MQWDVCVPHTTPREQGWHLSHSPKGLVPTAEPGTQDASVDVYKDLCLPHQEGTVTFSLPLPAVWVRTGRRGTWDSLLVPVDGIKVPNLQK